MNRFALLLSVVSILLSSFVTYQLVQSNKAGLSDQYIKKDDLKIYFDQYVDQGAETIFAAVVKGVELQKQADAEKKRMAILDSKDALENDPTTPYSGNEKADVNIVMFSDYLCGYCKKSAPILAKMLQDDPNLKLIVKEYPVLGQGSMIAAKAALAAFKIDKSKYPAMNMQLFEKTLGSEKDLLDMASAAGIDGAALLTEMATPENNQSIQQNQALGSKLGINGTPAFIIDGVLYPGAMSGEQLAEIVKNIRASRAAKKEG